jgi:hypothetical protein
MLSSVHLKGWFEERLKAGERFSQDVSKKNVEIKYKGNIFEDEAWWLAGSAEADLVGEELT